MVRVFQDFAVLKIHFRKHLWEISWQELWPKHQNIGHKILIYCSYSYIGKGVFEIRRIMPTAFNNMLKISVGSAPCLFWPYFCPFGGFTIRKSRFI